MPTDIENKNDTTKKANFETAILATEFGKFNYVLMFCAIPAAMTAIIDNTTASYVIPAATCDLEITLQQKGSLNSAVFIGYLLSSYLWGFMGDNFGRKKIIFLTLFCDFFINVCGAFMQTFLLQYIFKFLAGFFASGPYALIVTYISEFFSTQYRSKAVIMIGLYMMSVIAIMPLLAWVVMPLSNMFISNYVFHSWQLFIVLSTIPAFLGTIFFLLLPESPKYLMSAGQNDQALKIFQQIYHWNTGNAKEKYPIINLEEESINVNKITVKQKSYNKTVSIIDFLKLFNNGLNQMKELFQPPLLLNIIQCILINFGILLGANTLRLWLPQFYTSIDEYNQLNEINNATLCDAINNFYVNDKSNISFVNFTKEFDSGCEVVLPNDEVYINSVYSGIGCIVGNIFLILIVNYCVRKYLLAGTVIIGGCAALGVYFSLSRSALLTFSSASVGLEITSAVLLNSIIVELFPTTLRGVAVSITLMSGQLGSLFGNSIIPLLLEIGCLPPFLFVGCLVILSGLLCFTLPTPSGKDFK